MVGSLLAAAPLELSTLGKGDGLVELVWRQSPTLQSARARVAEAEAERRRTLRLPNPGLDLSVNTLPIGPLNPPDLKEPFLNVPNVSVGVSVLLELGKRGPRQDAAAEAARATVLQALEALRGEVFALEEVLGDVAAAQVRVATLESLADDAHRLSALQAARAQKGDASELDADRSRLEEAGTVSLLGAARDELASSLRACAALVATPCRPFADAPQAGAWLDRVGQPGEIARRPDVLALEAAARSARASELLARRGWIPDPTVRVGYVR
ncbi:MAG TPA: TolC family protein, partial [Archangium sp.]